MASGVLVSHVQALFHRLPMWLLVYEARWKELRDGHRKLPGMTLAGMDMKLSESRAL